MPVPFVKNDPRINRKGRPKKGQTMTDILNWALDQKRKITDGKTGKEKQLLLRQMLAEKLISRALDDGDVAAIKYIYDRLDGRPMQQLEIGEARNDIPADYGERRQLMAQIEAELALTKATRPAREETRSVAALPEIHSRGTACYGPFKG